VGKCETLAASISCIKRAFEVSSSLLGSTVLRMSGLIHSERLAQNFDLEINTKSEDFYRLPGCIALTDMVQRYLFHVREALYSHSWRNNHMSSESIALT